MTTPPNVPTDASRRALSGVRVVSLALNLPGPLALQRLAAMGASCLKIEPPARDAASADPMLGYSPRAYAELHTGIEVRQCDLKTAAGRDDVEHALAGADVLLTSFRMGTLARLGLDAARVLARHARLVMVAITAESGDRADHPGHDLTAQATAGLVSGVALPASPFADMAAALMATETVLRLLWQRERGGVDRGPAARFAAVSLADAAQFLALPRGWGITDPDGVLGGGHAGYGVYRCRDGRVALAALEARFADALCRAAGVSTAEDAAFAAFFASRSCAEVAALGEALGLPLVVLPDGAPG